MTKSGMDPQALAEMLATATARQAKQVRQTVYDSTLGALQGRELSLKNIRQVMGAVTEAAGAGAARSPLPAPDLQKLLASAVQGMDDALLKAVEANQVALQQFIDRGIDLRQTQLDKALGDLEKMEDMLLTAVRKGAASAQGPLEAAWAPVLDKLQLKGSVAGAQAASAAQHFEQQLDQMQSAMRQGRAATVKAAQSMIDGYAAMVSGVLIGLSDALRQGSAAPAPAANKRSRSGD